MVPELCWFGWMNSPIYWPWHVTPHCKNQRCHFTHKHATLGFFYWKISRGNFSRKAFDARFQSMHMTINTAR